MWGACFDQGQPHPGAGEGPRLLREAGLLEVLAQQGLDVEDHGDEVREREELDTKETRQLAVAQFSRVVRDKVLLGDTFTQLGTGWIILMEIDGYSGNFPPLLGSVCGLSSPKLHKCQKFITSQFPEVYFHSRVLYLHVLMRIAATS